MFCPQCGTKNPDGAAFCGGCGAQLPNRTAQAAPAADAAPQQPSPAAPQAAPSQPASGTDPAAQAAVPTSGFAPLVQKNKKKVVVGGVAAVVVVLGLFMALAGSAGDKSTDTGTTETTATETTKVKVAEAKKVAISEAINKKSVWFGNNDGITGSSSNMGTAYIFDGNGSVMVMPTGTLTAAELKGKSTDQIIKLVKKANKAWFESMKEEQVKYNEEQISNTKERISDAKNGKSNEDVEKLNENIETYRSNIEKIESLEYKLPESSSYSFHIVTDVDGKATSSETLQYTCEYWSITSEGEWEITQKAAQLEFTENSRNGITTFSDMSFRRFGNISTKLEDGANEQYVLDDPDADGVIVDA